jgi:hypothetical protein
MTETHYKIVEHDGGWAYTSQGVFSETYPTHDAAEAAARRAAAEQRVPGPQEAIEYQDEQGRWHSELASGNDRPDADVEP